FGKAREVDPCQCGCRGRLAEDPLPSRQGSPGHRYLVVGDRDDCAARARECVLDLSAVDGGRNPDRGGGRRRAVGGFDGNDRERPPAAGTTMASSPARAAYAAADAAVFPVAAHTTARAPASTAFATASAMPRSLNEPVGLTPSHLSHTSTPGAAESRAARSSGVDPSPSVTIGVDSDTGSASR